jgi:sulfur relay (sulfurtransferase) complex TusBCD TusD component (DsrE family)
VAKKWQKNVLNAENKIQRSKKNNQEQFQGIEKKQLDITACMESRKDRPVKDNAGHERGAAITMIDGAFSGGVDESSPDNI